MSGERIHSYREGQDMASHSEDKEYSLSRATDFATPRPKEDFPCIRQIMDLKYVSVH